MNYDAILFDYDGTVADSIADIAFAANRAAGRHASRRRGARPTHIPIMKPTDSTSSTIFANYW